jgi:type IV secretion system protein VirB3
MSTEVVIHRSLTEVILVAGVPRELAILNGGLTAALTFSLHSFWGIPLGLLVHWVALEATKRDPHFFYALRRHLLHKRRYEA